MKCRSTWLASLAAVALTGCATTGPAPGAGGEDQRGRSLVALQASDLRVATIAFRLATAGNDICPVRTALTGVTLHDPAQYAPELRAAAGLAEGVAVLAVVPASPGDKAGLRAGDTIRKIGGSVLSPTPPGRKPTYANVASAYRALDSAAQADAIALTVERDRATRQLTLKAVPGCASRVQLVPSARLQARADGVNLTITTAMLDYSRGDDELALIIAHEMAHNALGHRSALKQQGTAREILGSARSKVARVLEAEQAADRLGYYLMARAGFDVAFAPAFWQRLYDGPAADGGGPSTHPGRGARIQGARDIAAEIAWKRTTGQAIRP